MIDHEYTDNIVCPYCGYEDKDSWEIESSEEDLGLIECGNCNKHFYATRDITIKYFTAEARYGTCNHCKKENVPIEDHRSTLGQYKDLCTDCGRKEQHRMEVEYMNELDRDYEKKV